MSERPKLSLTLRARESGSSFADFPFASEEELGFGDAPPSSGGTIAKSETIKVTGAGLSVHDVLRFEGHEHLSKPFFFQLYVRLEPKASVPKNIAGKPLSIEFLNSEKKHLRFFHGLVAWAEEMEAPPPDGFRWISLGVCSAFEALSLTEDMRIFSEMPTIDIIKQVLNENNVDFDNKVKSSGKQRREFCVQYKESHFDFVSRLMEEEGIFYFFKFEKAKHVLVLADDISVYEAFGNALPFWTASPEGSLFSNRIWRFKRRQRNVLQKISLNDYFFERPNQSLFVSKERKETLSLESYDYPGRFQKEDPKGDIEAIAKRRLEAVESSQVVYKGLSSALNFSAGVKFSLTNHPQEGFDGRYVALSVHHFYGYNPEGQALFQNTFKAIPETTPFRPVEKSPKPFATQDTAEVVGPKGDEIHVDQFGRIKVKFHWDRRPESKVKDEDRSCWIRVASGWAGSGWGMLHTPRVGQEVVVAFLNNNPDRPLVIGCVYNGENLPPYVNEKTSKSTGEGEKTGGDKGAAIDWTKSTLKSRSTTKGTGDNYNEICFRDKKGEEKISVQAEKDADIFVKDSVDVEIQGNTKTQIGGSRKVVLGAELKKSPKDKSKTGDDSLTLESGTRTVELKGSPGHLNTIIKNGNNTLKITKGNDETTINTGDIEISLHAGKKKTTITGGGYTLTVAGGDVSIKTTGKFKVEAAAGISFKTPLNVDFDCMKFSVKAAMDIDLTAGMKFDAKGGMQASLEAGGMASVKAGAMASVKAAIVMLN